MRMKKLNLKEIILIIMISYMMKIIQKLNNNNDYIIIDQFNKKKSINVIH